LSKEFVKVFRERYSENPDEFAAYAYAGLEILRDAMRRADTKTDRVALRTALTTTGLDTVVGPFRFLPNREPDHPSVVQVVRHGRLAILK
jgi:branched-chain amino acid transport system substrate-binding protein